MVKFNLIVARSRNDVIGIGPKIPWDLPEDLKMFKETTMNSILIMGRKTYESIGRPLPGRITIVVTRDESFSLKEDYQIGDKDNYKGKGMVVNSVEDAILQSIKIKKKYNVSENIWVAGGSQIYKEFLNKKIIKNIKLTEVDVDVNDNDAVYFIFDQEEFKMEKEEKLQSKNGIFYTISYFSKKEKTKVWE